MSSANKMPKIKARVRRKRRNEPMKPRIPKEERTEFSKNSNTQLVQKSPENALSVEFSSFVCNCSICDDKICNGYIFKLPCGHGFGEVCADAWIYLHERCPTCYSKFEHAILFERNYSNSDEKSMYTKALLNAKKKIGISGTLAGSFVAGGEAASQLFEGAAIVASEIITVGTTSGMEKNIRARAIIQPKMSDAEKQLLKKRIETAKFVAGATATVTGCVANVVGTGLWALGSLVAPLIKRGSKRLLTELEMEEGRANDVVEGAMELAKGALLSTGKMLRGLEHATTVVASSAASNAARLYEFSRGLEPGELEADVESITRNVVETAWNVRALPPKTLASISRSVQPPHKSNSTAVMRYGES